MYDRIVKFSVSIDGVSDQAKVDKLIKELVVHVRTDDNVSSFEILTGNLDQTFSNVIEYYHTADKYLYERNCDGTSEEWGIIVAKFQRETKTIVNVVIIGHRRNLSVDSDYVEKLKIDLKNIVVESDLKNEVYWVEDLDNRVLLQSLYSLYEKLENNIRGFLVMLHNVEGGISGNEGFLNATKEVSPHRIKNYKKNFKKLAGINSKIMQSQFSDLINSLKESKELIEEHKAIKKMVKERLIKEKGEELNSTEMENLYSDFPSNWFDDYFLSNWFDVDYDEGIPMLTMVKNHRNNVMHNKLYTRDVFRELESTLKELNNEFEFATHSVVRDLKNPLKKEGA